MWNVGLVWSGLVRSDPSIHTCMHLVRRQSGGEAFCPVCLPAFSTSAFMHAYIYYFEGSISSSEASASAASQGSQTAAQEMGQGQGESSSSSSPGQPVPRHSLPGTSPGGCLYLVLLAPSSDNFHALHEARVGMEAGLSKTGALGRLVAATAASHHASSGSAASSSGRASPAPGPAPSMGNNNHQAATAHGLGPGGHGALAAVPVVGAVGGRVSIEALPPPLGGPLGTTALWHFMARVGPRRQVSHGWAKTCRWGDWRMRRLYIPWHWCMLRQVRLRCCLVLTPSLRLPWHIDMNMPLPDHNCSCCGRPLRSLLQAQRGGSGWRQHTRSCTLPSWMRGQALRAKAGQQGLYA